MEQRKCLSGNYTPEENEGKVQRLRDRLAERGRHI